MGTSKSAAPAPPNPIQMAQGQTNSNISTAAANSYLNAINQYTPEGNVIWKQTGTRQMGDGSVSIPEWQVHTELSPDQQRLRNSQMAVSQGTSDLAKAYVDRIRDATATPFSYEGMPAAPVYDENARIAARDRIVARQSPIFARDEDALRTRLSNQGLQAGTEAWNNDYDNFGRAKNDYYLGADVQAGDEASRIFGLQGQMRDRAIGEEITRRSQPINEVAALLGTGPGVQQPQFQSTRQEPIAPTDTMTPQMFNYQSQQQNWQQQQQSQNALMGSIFGLAGAGLGGWGTSGFKKFW